MWRTAKSIINRLLGAPVCKLCGDSTDGDSWCKECRNAVNSANYHMKKRGICFKVPIKEKILMYAYGGKKREHFMRKFRRTFL